MGLFKTLIYASLGMKCLEKVVDEIDRFLPKKETVYIVYKEKSTDKDEPTNKEEPKFEEKEVEKNSK